MNEPENQEVDAARGGDLLTTFLADSDAECPRCGYNLRGLRTPQCPECGDALQLQIGLVEPKLAAFITLLIALCLGFGGSSLLGIIALANAPSHWWGNASAIILMVQWIWTGIALPITVRQRRKFRKFDEGRQWWLAGIALALVVVACLLIVLFFDS